VIKYHTRKDQWCPRFLDQGVSEMFCLCLSQLPNVLTSYGITGCMRAGLTYRSKQLIEIDRISTSVQHMYKLACFKNVYIFNFKKV